MIIAGTIRNSVSLASLESKWQQKKQGISKGKKENLTAEERELQRFQEQADKIRESKKSTDIDTKLQAGGELTAEEIEYLKKNDPDALKEYEEVQRERASYKKQLKNCKSKEEVEKLKMTKMGHYMAEAKEIMNDPYIPKAKKYELMKKCYKRLLLLKQSRRSSYNLQGMRNFLTKKKKPERKSIWMLRRNRRKRRVLHYRTYR